MQNPIHKSRGRRPDRVERLGRFASRVRRPAFEALERRGMLTAVIASPSADREMPAPADAEPPAGDEVAVAEGFSIAECWITPPGDDGAPPAIDVATGEPDPIPAWIEGDGSVSDGSTDWVWDAVDDQETDSDSVRTGKWIRCGTDPAMHWLGDYLVGQYREFVGQNPTLPEEHGAGGIQLNISDFDSPVPVTALSVAGNGGTPKSAGMPAVSFADAAWASFFTSQAGSESAGTAPVGGRRRGR